MFQSIGNILRRETRAIRHVWSAGPNWRVITGLMLVHGGALASLFFFSWEGVVACSVLFVLTGLGVTVGLHRYFNHGSFQTSPWMRTLLGVIGQLAGQGTVLHWVAIHRKHHHLVEQDGDPHSPRHRGFLWAHCLWLMVWMSPQASDNLYETYTPLLRKDPLIRWLQRFGPLLHIALGLFLFGVGYLYGGWSIGLSVMLMGMFLRLTMLFHITWSVNSIGHLFGYRNKETEDDSRNLWFLALLSFGEHLHAGHHDHPSLAHFAHRWFEYFVDTGYWAICVLERLRLIWGVKRLSSTAV